MRRLGGGLVQTAEEGISERYVYSPAPHCSTLPSWQGGQRGDGGGGGGLAQGLGGWLCWPVAAPIGLSPLNLLLTGGGGGGGNAL